MGGGVEGRGGGKGGGKGGTEGRRERRRDGVKEGERERGRECVGGGNDQASKQATDGKSMRGRVCGAK